MALGLMPEHLELATAVRGWTGRHVGQSVIRAAVDAGDAGTASYLRDLAPALAEQGLLGLQLPEADGGQGFGLVELAVATEELGRALLPGAFVPTVLASSVLAAASGPAAALAGPPGDGSLAAAVCLARGLAADGDRRSADGGRVVTGSASPVLAGPAA